MVGGFKTRLDSDHAELDVANFSLWLWDGSGDPLKQFCVIYFMIFILLNRILGVRQWNELYFSKPVVTIRKFSTFTKTCCDSWPHSASVLLPVNC